MPNAVDKEPAAPASPQGCTYEFTGDQDRREGIDAAFDYRGDITLRLANGETVEGFIFNRNPNAKPPVLQLFVKGEATARILPYADLAALSFTGKDPADGKSYLAWKAKKHGERQDESRQVEAEMREHGYL